MFLVIQLIACSFLFTSIIFTNANAVNDTRERQVLPLLSSVKKSPLGDVLRLNPSLPASLGDRTMACNSRRFGTPPIASCTDAMSQMPQPGVINRRRSYGLRGAAAQSYDVELPKRWISCKDPL